MSNHSMNILHLINKNHRQFVKQNSFKLPLRNNDFLVKLMKNLVEWFRLIIHQNDNFVDFIDWIFALDDATMVSNIWIKIYEFITVVVLFLKNQHNNEGTKNIKYWAFYQQPNH